MSTLSPKIGNVGSFLVRAFYTVFGLLFAYMTFHVLRKNLSVLQSKLSLFSLFVFVFLIAVVLWLRSKLDAIPARRFSTLLLLLAASYGAFCFWVSTQLKIVLPIDLAFTYGGVGDLLRQGHLSPANVDYFANCNNNIFLLLVLTALYWLGGFVGVHPNIEGQWLGVALAVSGMVLTLLLVCRYMWLLRRRNTDMLLVFLLFVLFAPFYFWPSVFYTDVLALPFVMGTVLLFQRYWQTKHVPWLVLCAFITAMGFLLKGTPIVLVAAIPLAMVLFFKPANGAPYKTGQKKNIAAVMLFLILIFILTVPLIKWYTASDLFHLQDKKDRNTPIAFWFYLGSKGDGAYHKEDFKYAAAIQNPKERSRMLIQQGMENYKNMSTKAYHDFQVHKMLLTWGEPIFEIDVYGQWVTEGNWLDRFMQSTYFQHTQLLRYSAAYMALLYLAFAVGLFQRLLQKESSATEFLSHLTIFGVILFLSIFETAPRRAIIVLPLMMAGASIAILDIETALRRRFEKPKAAVPALPSAPLPKELSPELHKNLRETKSSVC